MENKCLTETGCCETTAAAKECCGMSECACPLETSIGLWKSAFFQAMKETHVEVLKEKIKKAWGDKLDKQADAVVEAMGIQWQSWLAAGKSKLDLKEKIAKIMAEGKR